MLNYGISDVSNYPGAAAGNCRYSFEKNECFWWFQESKLYLFRYFYFLVKPLFNGHSFRLLTWVIQMCLLKSTTVGKETIYSQFLSFCIYLLVYKHLFWSQTVNKGCTKLSNDINWPRRLACAMRSLAIVITIVQSFFLSLLFFFFAFDPLRGISRVRNNFPPNILA